MNQKPREIAIRLIADSGESGVYLESRVDRALDAAGMAPVNRRLVRQLVYGVVRWRGVLDWLVERRAGGRRQRPVVRAALQLGLYQLFWLDRIPAHAAIHETLQAAKSLGVRRETGFLNAVLRAFEREREGTRKWLADLEIKQPWLAQSHPRWLWERWRKRWGGEVALSLMKWNNAPSRTFVRLNHLREAAAGLPARWKEFGVICRPVNHDWHPGELVFELESPGPIASLAGFSEGEFYVQDPSTLLAVECLDPQPGETLLDACAAPGGKTTYMAQRMRNQGRIFAHDIQESRRELIAENCRRLGVECVQITDTLEVSDRSGFDRILIDAPCSNTGVMGRRVDLRWRIRPDELERLQSVQLDILERCAPRLKPGGCLVYSTCSLEEDENQLLVQRFLAKHSKFRLHFERALTPFQDQADGAYVAKLVNEG